MQLTDNKILLGHSYDGSYYLAGSIITIDENNNLTLKKDKHLLYEDKAISSSRGIKMIKLNENNVIIFNSTGLLSCAKLIISDDDMILGKCTVVSTHIDYGNYTVSNLIGNDKLMIVGSTDGNIGFLYGTVVKINNNLTVDKDIALNSIKGSGWNGNFITVLNDNIFIGYAYDGDNKLNGILGKIDDNIDKTNISDNILGVAKTSGKSNEIVQVYVPKTEHYLLTEEGNQLIGEEGEIIKCIL